MEEWLISLGFTNIINSVNVLTHIRCIRPQLNLNTGVSAHTEQTVWNQQMALGDVRHPLATITGVFRFSNIVGITWNYLHLHHNSFSGPLHGQKMESWKITAICDSWICDLKTWALICCFNSLYSSGFRLSKGFWNLLQGFGPIQPQEH